MNQHKHSPGRSREIRMARLASYWFAGLAVLSSAFSAMAAPPQAIDRGPLTVLAADTPISVTIALALPALDEAEKLQQALYTPGDPQFHKFLTADQFVARFAPSGAENRTHCCGAIQIWTVRRK